MIRITKLRTWHGFPCHRSPRASRTRTNGAWWPRHGTSWRAARDGHVVRTASPAPAGGTPARRLRRRAPVLLLMWLLVAVLLPGALPAPSPAHAAPTTKDEAPQAGAALDVQITTMTPAVLRPGEDWTFKGTVTNTTEDDLCDPVVRLRLQTYVPYSRSALAAWNISGSSYSPIVLRAHHLGKDLAPGQSARFSFEIPAKDSPFSEYSEWGPRGIAVTATSGQVRDAQRTTVLWYPDHDPIE